MRWLSGRRSLPVLLLFAAALAVLITAFLSSYRANPDTSPTRPSPPLIDNRISNYIDVSSLGLTITRLGWDIAGGLPPVGSERAQSMALATKSAVALLPAGSPQWYRLIVLTVTIDTLSSPQWHGPCVCWMVEVVVDPTPTLALECPDAKPPVRSEGVVVLIDALSGEMLREERGGGLPWVAGRGCPALNPAAG